MAHDGLAICDPVIFVSGIALGKNRYGFQYQKDQPKGTQLIETKLTSKLAAGIEVILDNKSWIFVGPPNLQPVVVASERINIIVEPKSETRAPLVVLVLGPTIIDTGSIELCAVEFFPFSLAHRIGFYLP